MRKDEAYKELGLNPGATEEQIKSAFRKAAAKSHPDRFTDPAQKQEAEDKFKKLNTAQQILLNPQPEMNNFPNSADFGGFRRSHIEDMFEDFFGSGFGFGGSPFQHVNRNQSQNSSPFKEHIYLDINFSFEEAMLGTEKEVKYSRHNKCNKCNGYGRIPGSNTCKTCGGKGKFTHNQNNFVFEQVCPSCHGQGGQMDTCDKCNGTCVENQEITAKVRFPPILADDKTVRIAGGGNFVSTNGRGDAYTDLLIKPTILNKQNGIQINQDGDIESTLTISLLEALTGTNKVVYTVKGDKEINIKPLSKNRDFILIKNCGVGGVRDHKVYLNVEYPRDSSKLIDVLITTN